ncbi:MAG: hypothetical protein FD156_425 [Nitrospirae bacterium]|nr:MAG: hypothetical protein FD156_425 [Nitrospirota bacterium]
MSNKLAEELKSVRKVKGVSLREVEKATEISNAYLSQLERGEATNPSPNILYKLAEYYEIPYSSLMEAAGYLKKSKVEKGEKTIKPSTMQAALMSAGLTDEEENLVAHYIGYLRSQRQRSSR